MNTRRDFFRLGGRRLLQKLADIAAPSIDTLLGQDPPAQPPDAAQPPRPPLSADEAGHALRTMRKKHRPNLPPSDKDGSP